VGGKEKRLRDSLTSLRGGGNAGVKIGGPRGSIIQFTLSRLNLNKEGPFFFSREGTLSAKGERSQRGPFLESGEFLRNAGCLLWKGSAFQFSGRDS